MATRISVAARNAAVNAIAALLNSGTVEIRTGTQPASPDAGDSGTLLVSIPLANPAFGSPSNGQAALAGVPRQAQAQADGTAGHARFKTSGGQAVLDVSVSDLNGNGELKLDNVNIADGQQVNIISFSLSQPQE